MNGWQVPAHPLPKDMETIVVQRIVVRSDLSMQLALNFIDDAKRAIIDLNEAHYTLKQTAPTNKKIYGFTH